MAWQWFHRWGSPRWFYERSPRWTRWLGTGALVLIVVGTIWGLCFAPPEARQGNSYRILYIHVPTIFISMAGYVLMAVAGAIGLIWKMKMGFMVMRCAAPIGSYLTFAALVTGAVWGKPTWGTWFMWGDPKIMFTLLMLFLYIGVVVLQASYRSQKMADEFSAVLAIVGSVNIPIIYYATRFWSSLHQGASIKIIGKSTIDVSMIYPLLIMIAGFYLFYFWVLMKAVRSEVLVREQKTQWVKDLIANQ